MKLIGMLDSPYVRRTAIAFEYLGVPFEHEAVSVFRTFEKFHALNPVVKAPTLVCDDGEVLMDSTLILHYVEATKTQGRTLWSSNPAALQHDFRAVGLALAACDKAVQIIYERNLRPASAQYEPWLERVRGQLLAACRGLDEEVQRRQIAFSAGASHATITAAVTWRFTQIDLAAIVQAADFPALAALSVRMEQTPQFTKYPPVGPGVQAPAHP
jgi:glutathione S-transferase